MEHQYSFNSLQKRLLCIISIIAFLFLCVIGKLFIVQIIQGKTLQSRAIDQWTRDLPILGTRGDILDRNNNVLASSYTSYNIYLRASNIKNPENVAYLLSQKLNLDYTTLLEKASKKNVSETLIAQQVENETVKEILKLNLDGVYISETSTRLYPYQDALTSVLGFTTIDNKGQSGLEAYYDNYLTGTNGKTLTESTITGVELSNATTSFIPGISGCSINLTIDINIQQILENATQNALNDHKAKTVTAIMMNAQNGEILGMVSKPSFDLNNPPRDDIEKLLAYSKNINIVDVYEPGSTFKIFTTASALNENLTSQDERFFDPGFRIVDGEKIKCWRTKGHGSQSLAEAFANSCNSVFMDLGLRLGKEKLYSYLEKFGIGATTGVDFYGESAGIMMNVDSVKNVDLARISFGQAIAVTPLQMVTGVCSILNGTLYQPHFIKSITSQDGTTKEFSSIALRKVVSQSTSTQIAQMMEGVVSTKGLYSFVPGYRIGGKTGTAQKYENGSIANGKYVSSFIGCYPVENPQYVLLLCVDEPSTGIYYGSQVAAPYGKEIFSGLFTYLNIAPTNLTQDLEKLLPTIEVPNLIGLSITQAVSLIKKMKLEYEIEGEEGTIIWQSIPAGEKVFKGAIIMIKT